FLLEKAEHGETFFLPAKLTARAEMLGDEEAVKNFSSMLALSLKS
ncbi:MAG: hypothetical protein JO006_00815, partial [Paucibacter sp.]|nr:hypothetical protein [Roseateles sp.]